MAKPGKKPTGHNYAIYRPAISYAQAAQSYFVHAGAVHSVPTAPASVFKAAILACRRDWVTNGNYSGLLHCSDLVTRWFLLVSLCEAGAPLTLVSCREVMGHSPTRE
jgi:hypothetical protein